MKEPVRKVAAAEFKAKCLAMLDDVEGKRRSLVITKRGRPVARVVPLSKASSGSLQGSLVFEAEDILEPIGAAWEAKS